MSTKLRRGQKFFLQAFSGNLGADEPVYPEGGGRGVRRGYPQDFQARRGLARHLDDDPEGDPVLVEAARGPEL